MAYKRQVVRETFDGDRSVAAVAREHGLNANMVFCWRRDPRLLPRDVQSTKSADFVPVEVRSGPLVGPSAGSDDHTGEVELVFRQGHRLVLRGAFDPDRVLALVRGLSSL